MFESKAILQVHLTHFRQCFLAMLHENRKPDVFWYFFEGIKRKHRSKMGLPILSQCTFSLPHENIKPYDFLMFS